MSVSTGNQQQLNRHPRRRLAAPAARARATRAARRNAFGAFECLENRRLLAHVAGHDPVIELRFDEAPGSATVTDSAAAGGVATGTLAGDILPVFGSDNPSPAGGNYLTFNGDGIYRGAGGRVDMAELLNPILGGTASLSYYIRTFQVGVANPWQSPGVTGAEQDTAGDDIFWGNLDPEGRARVVAGNGAVSASTLLGTGDWVRVTHTRNAVSGVVKTYVNGVFISQATSETGQKGANFRAIGATTVAAANLTDVLGYNYLQGDLDQVEVFDRELTAQEVSRFHGPSAAAVPAAPTPLSATANTPTQVTLTFTDVADEAGYAVYRSDAGGAFNLLATFAPDQTTYVDRTVTQGTQYAYQVIAFNQAGSSVAATGNVTTPVPGVDAVIVYNFNEGAGTAVEDVSTEGNDIDAALAGDFVPEFRTDGASPAGGSYLHFDGGRVDANELLNPILGRTATLTYYVRTTQTGADATWQSPGVTGAEQAGGGSDIFWGNLDAAGRARVVAGNGAAAATNPINTGNWYRVVHTRSADTGVVRTYVNGVVVSQATSETGEKAAPFRSFGATTLLPQDLSTVSGYVYFVGDLDQIEVYDRELSPTEVTQRYGAPAAALPATPAPVTAVATSPTQVTLTVPNLPNEAGYTVLRSTTAAGPFVEVGAIPADQTTFVDNGVTFGTQYFYQVIAYNAAGTSGPATASATTPFPALNPVIVYNFNEGAGTTVEDSSGTNDDNDIDGVLAGNVVPAWQTTNPSPAGGSYLTFTVSAPGTTTNGPTFQNQGGRVDANELLNPILGATSSVSYFIRTQQVGRAATWQSPGVTGAEHAGGGNDVFWGNLDDQGRARVAGGNGAAAASTPVNTGQWIHVVHTRNATSGVVRTYVNGVLVATANSETGVKGAEFRAIGANTDVAGDLTTIQGYNYLDGDLDQVEIFDRELSEREVAHFYAPAQVPVAEVYVRGSTWAGDDGAATVTFKEFMQNAGVGHTTYGYKLPAAPTNADTVSWINVDEIVVRYAAPVSGAGVPTAGTIVVDGVRQDYTVTQVIPIDDRTFALRLDRPLGNIPGGGIDGDRVRLTIPGAGVGGANFTQLINVLQGDASRDVLGRVNAADQGYVKARVNRTSNAPGTPPQTLYTVFADVNADGRVNAVDQGAVKSRVNDGMPALPAGAGTFSATRIAEEVLA